MPSLRSLLTTRGRAFLAAGVTLVLCGVLLGFPDLTRFGILLVGLPFIGALLVRSRRTRLRISRHVRPEQVAAGTTAQVTLELENLADSPTPVFLAEEGLDPALGPRPRFVVDRIAPHAARPHRLVYPIEARARGRRVLGPLHVRIKDPFGLATRGAVLEGSTDLLVLPAVTPLSSTRQPGSGVGSEGEQAHLIALHGEDDVTVRDYRDGDDLRRIHWPSTARTGALMVRQEDRPAQRRAVVLLDPRPEAHGGTGETSSFEWAVEAVASVAVHLDESGYAVHLVCAETVADGRAADPLATEEILAVLAETRMRPRSAGDELLTAAQALASAGGFVVGVLGAHDLAVTARVSSLRQPGTTAVALVLDAATFGPTDADEVDSHVVALRLAGWRALPVHHGDRVEHAWAALTAATVGGGVR